MATPLDYFPTGSPRQPQVKALDFVRRAFEAGFRDVVVEAPCGSGKSFIACALALWGQDQSSKVLDGADGGYVLVNQKILQDQMAADMGRFDLSKGRPALIKSAVEYNCVAYKLCSHGGQRGCAQRKSGLCPYKMAKDAFISAPLSITNYAYFFTSRAYVENFISPRRILCLDECHNLAKLVISFVDVKVGGSTLEDFANVDLRHDIGSIDTMAKFIPWLTDAYLPAVAERVAWSDSLADNHDVDATREAYAIKQHFLKVQAAVERLKLNTEDWIFWQQETKFLAPYPRKSRKLPEE